MIVMNHLQKCSQPITLAVAIRKGVDKESYLVPIRMSNVLALVSSWAGRRSAGARNEALDRPYRQRNWGLSSAINYDGV